MKIVVVMVGVVCACVCVCGGEGQFVDKGQPQRTHPTSGAVDLIPKLTLMPTTVPFEQ